MFTKKLTLIISLIVSSAQSFASDFNAVCPSGQTLYYNIIDGSMNKVEVTYPGNNGGYWTGYTKPSGIIEIPSTVSYCGVSYSVVIIGDCAFNNCNDVLSVYIPNSITKIGNSAFYLCGISEVSIPNSVRVIGYDCFDGCPLSSVDVSASVERMGYRAFGNITNYGVTWDDNLPDGVIYLGKIAYVYKGSMPTNTSITLASDTKGIAGRAFYGQMNLVSINFPNSLLSIGQEAFYGCGGINTITIPNSVNYIGEKSFYQCVNLSTLNYNAISAIVDVENDWNVVGVFMGCDNLTELNVGNSVQVIPDHLFSYCNHITGSIVLPTSIHKIGSYSFCSCSGVTSVTIPMALDTVGNRPFLGCTSLHTVNYNAINCYSTSVTTLFDGCYLLSSIVFGSNVISIPDYLCFNLSSLNGTLNLPSTLQEIGDYAFSGCSGFTGSLTIPNSVVSIGEQAFIGCSGISVVTIGTGLSSIGSYAFGGMSSITTINFNAINCNQFPQNGWVFSGEAVTTLNIGANVHVIPDGLVYGCTNLTSVLLPSSVTIIGKQAFNACGLQGTITIPESVSSIGCGAFNGSLSISEVICQRTTPPTVEHYNGIYYIFTGCWDKPLYVPSGSVSAYQSAPGWNNFTNIIGVDAIDDNVFEQLQIYALSNEIIVKGVEGQSLSVWGIDGRNVVIIDKALDQTIIPVPTAGVYIVRIGTNTVKKVIVR